MKHLLGNDEQRARLSLEPAVAADHLIFALDHVEDLIRNSMQVKRRTTLRRAQLFIDGISVPGLSRRQLACDLLAGNVPLPSPRLLV